MSWSHPFELLHFSYFTISRAPRIAICEGWESPCRFLLVPPQYRGSTRGLKRVRQTRNQFESDRDEFRCLSKKSSDRLGHHTPFLGLRSTLNEHFQVELLACQSL